MSARWILVAAMLVPAAAGAVPRGCFTRSEMMAEYTFQHSLRLREGAARCEELGLAEGTAEEWHDFADDIGPWLAAEMEKRRKAFSREFERDAALAQRHWDGRIYGWFRYRPLTGPYCDNLSGMLDQLRQGGWNAFRTQAQRERGELAGQVTACPN